MTADTLIRVHRNGKDVGYFTPDTARQSLLSGVLRADDWAFYDGLPDWTPLAVLLEQSRTSPTLPPIVTPPPVIRTPPPIPYQPLPARASPTRTGRPALVVVLIAAAVAFVFVVSLVFSGRTAISEVKIPVSAAEFGDRWPLTVSSGYIIRRERKIPNASFKSYSVIFESPDGTRYGLNGHALTEGYRNIHAITKSHLVFGEPRYEDVSGLISIGLNGKR
ncbi:MAG: DUF4339 domain-containing protein [Verrucomicrobia bacterium]|nr:DUF4339 domain-containing protein [Verrucomicrobiota bacterium]